MKYQKAKWYKYLIILVGIAACVNGEDRYLGKIAAPNSRSINFKVYQSDEFEQFTALTCEIVDKNDSLIKFRTYLCGTDLYERDTKNFYPGEFDSIIYLAYFHPNEIVAIYDLRNHKGYPFDGRNDEQVRNFGDSLVKRAQTLNKDLVGYWQH
ncbi:MAG: hypothetical protein R3A50_00095 [Saprospiraceae bacterium]|nr:hypothetical protein [Saprospiraceae bacterium]MCB9345087.1 hypothetical protein [Lewinellaceae bacterium]